MYTDISTVLLPSQTQERHGTISDRYICLQLVPYMVYQTLDVSVLGKTVQTFLHYIHHIKNIPLQNRCFVYYHESLFLWHHAKPMGIHILAMRPYTLRPSNSSYKSSTKPRKVISPFSKWTTSRICLGGKHITALRLTTFLVTLDF